MFEDLEFHGCSFLSCLISITEHPELRSTIRNVKLVHCKQRGSTVYSGVFEDVVVDGLQSQGQLLQVWGAVFKHVVLKGRIDRLMISSVVDLMGDKPAYQQAFDVANAAYYETVDWALDISEGEFKELDIRGVSSRLIRRDAETQMIVTRESATRCDVRSLPLKETLWATWIRNFLQDGDPDVVLVAPKRHPKFRNYLDDLVTLEKAGVAYR